MKHLLIPLVLATAFATAQDSPQKIPDAILFSSYRITVTKDDRVLECGSGIAIDKHHVLTANHVVDSEGGTIRVDIFDRDGIYQRSIPIKIVRLDKDADLALLETEDDLP